MKSNKRSDPNQSTHWHELTENIEEDARDEDNAVTDDPENSEIPNGLENSSEESDEGSIENDSGDESDTSYAETEHTSDEEPPLEGSEVKIFSTRSGRQWTAEEPPKRKLSLASIIKQRIGVERLTTTIETVKDAFQCLITKDRILLLETDSNEIWAFIGILILAGVHRSKNADLNDLWSTINERPIFRATMAKNRFKSLLRFCRFDNIATREQRLKGNKLAPIRELWLMFLAQLRICYTPGESLAVDEQLILTCDRCNFHQYIPSKPGKYGLKILWCWDSSTAYPLNRDVYLGRQSETSAATQATNRISNLVKRPVRPWINTDRTVTTDNYFSSVELGEELLGMNTTLVGTMRRSKKEIPR
ncbi:unnamed protein product [Rotaria socialis]|uniref:PiggyBac transposable element-derived protein domain-containing protein n=1 Tax=Rotaria socialis TaxID=392032 RepID=A0A821UTK6_9BILA|nr:unnamed protein product [Rotaria socialis]